MDRYNPRYPVSFSEHKTEQKCSRILMQTRVLGNSETSMYALKHNKSIKLPNSYPKSTP